MPCTLAGPVASLAAALRNLSPDLRWDRSHTARRDGRTCYDGHANALIAGPGGREERDDKWV